MAPYFEQVPTFLDWLMDKSTQPDNNMIVDEPASVAAESNPQPLTPVNNTAMLLYNDKNDIKFST